MSKIKVFSFLLILGLNLYVISNSLAQEAADPTVDITFPLPGEAVQGLLQIYGTVNVDDIDFYTLEFAYHDSTDQTWFGISKGENIIVGNLLGEWDTSSIPDGTYNLRLTVTRMSFDPIFLIVEGIRVRNYSQIETNTPTPTGTIPTHTPSLDTPIFPTATLEPTTSPTPFPPNSAVVSKEDLQKTLIRGSIGGVVIFITFLIYRATRKRK